MAAIEKNGSCNSADMVKELDQLYEECGSISSPVDVLVQDLYPPLPVLSMEEQVSARVYQFLLQNQRFSYSK